MGATPFGDAPESQDLVRLPTAPVSVVDRDPDVFNDMLTKEQGDCGRPVSCAPPSHEP